MLKCIFTLISRGNINYCTSWCLICWCDSFRLIRPQWRRISWIMIWKRTEQMWISTQQQISVDVVKTLARARLRRRRTLMFLGVIWMETLVSLLSLSCLLRTSYRRQLITWLPPRSPPLNPCLCQPSICCHGSVWKTWRQKGKRQGLPSAFPRALSVLFLLHSKGFTFVFFFFFHFCCDFPRPWSVQRRSRCNFF